MMKPQNEIGIAMAATTTIQLDSVSDTRIGHVSCWLINKSVFLLAPLQTKNPMSKFLPPHRSFVYKSHYFPGPEQGQGHFYMAGEKKGATTKHLLLMPQSPVMVRTLKCQAQTLWPAANEISGKPNNTQSHFRLKMFASRLVVFSNGEKGKSMVTYCGSVLFAFFIGPPAKGSGNWELETGNWE